jgi:hypothetical protein
VVRPNQSTPIITINYTVFIITINYTVFIGALYVAADKTEAGTHRKGGVVRLVGICVF